MRKLFILMFCAALSGIFGSCTDPCDRSHEELQNIPNVVKGTFPAAKLTPAIGDEIVFAPKLYDDEGVEYLWLLNGREVSAESEFSFVVEGPCRADVKLILTKGYAKAEMKSEILCQPDFASGFLVVQEKRLDYYDNVADRLCEDIYSSMNKGEGSGAGELHVTEHNGKLYLTRMSSTSNADHLFVADAKTLFEQERLPLATYLNGIMPISASQGIASHMNGVFRINMSSLTKVDIRRQYGFALYNTIVADGKLFANTTFSAEANVVYYDLDDILKAGDGELGDGTPLDILQNGRVNFVADNSGRVYTIGYDNDEAGYYLAQIAEGMEIVKTPLSFVPKKCGYQGRAYTAGLTISDDGSYIYIAGDGNEIYRYLIGDPASLDKEFIKAVDDSMTLCGSGVNVEPATGNLYVCYTYLNEDSRRAGKIVVYTPTGGTLKTIECGEGVYPSALIF